MHDLQKELCLDQPRSELPAECKGLSLANVAWDSVYVRDVLLSPLLPHFSMHD